MFKALHRYLQELTGRRTAFPPPRAGDPESMQYVRACLHEWFEADPADFDAFFLRAKPSQFVVKGGDRFGRALAWAGLARPLDRGFHMPRVRLFLLQDKLIATDLLAHRDESQVFSLMFEQVYLVRNMDVRPGDEVLELCLGSGVNSLFAAERAAHVNGVDINPRALAFARFNMALNDQVDAIELHEGSLFDPLDEERRFDLILVNPPFELVPPDAKHFLHSHGGEDGLDVVRDILKEAPRRLRNDGRFEIITYSTGNETKRIRLLDLLRDAFPQARIEAHLLNVAPIDEHLAPFKKAPGFDAWAQRLKESDDTHVHFIYARVETAEPRDMDVRHPTQEIAASHAISDVWC